MQVCNSRTHTNSTSIEDLGNLIPMPAICPPWVEELVAGPIKTTSTSRNPIDLISCKVNLYLRPPIQQPDDSDMTILRQDEESVVPNVVPMKRTFTRRVSDHHAKHV